MAHRKDRIDRIEVRIGRLATRARELFEREQAALADLERLREAAGKPTGRLRAARTRRALRRTEELARRLQSERERLAHGELRSIMIALQEQARRTRDRLDRELDRLAPVEEEWERLRTTFDTLEVAVQTPALESLADHWHGVLEIPEFPVREHEGYAKPFPEQVLLF